MRAQLTEIKAVSAGYPGAGQLRWRPERCGRCARRSVPRPGRHGSRRLASSLNRAELPRGRQHPVAGGAITPEPDRGLNFFSVAPRLLMNLGDLDATG
jgi:putative ABC transport system permease protein